MSHRLILLALVAAALLPATADARMAYICKTADICLAGDDGSDPKPLTSNGGTIAGNYRSPGFTPNGRLLSVEGNEGVFVYDLGTLQRTQITNQETSGSNISPDGKLLAALEDRSSREVDGYLLCIYATSTPLQTTACDTYDQPAVMGLDYGPDNRLYTSIADPATPGAYKVCRRATTTAACEADVITDSAHDIRTLAISPDGKQVAVNWMRGFGATGVYGPIAVYDLATGKLVRQLTADDSADYDPAWSRDGKSIAFSRGDSGLTRDIYTIPAAGKPGDEKLLVPEGRQPTFGATVKPESPGLEQFSAKADGKAVSFKLLVVDSDSTVRATLKKGYGKALVEKDVVAGKHSYKVKLSRKGKRKLRKDGSLKVTLKVTVTPPEGVTASGTDKVTLG